MKANNRGNVKFLIAMGSQWSHIATHPFPGIDSKHFLFHQIEREHPNYTSNIWLWTFCPPICSVYSMGVVVQLHIFVQFSTFPIVCDGFTSCGTSALLIVASYYVVTTDRRYLDNCVDKK